jgi:hypothetical protein
MSLLGKILAFLNILGAAALLALGAMDYAQRKMWAFRVFQYGLVIDGLPVDAAQVDPQGRPIADKIGEQMQSELFGPVGGKPVVTQTAEVERVQRLLQARIDAEKDKKRQVLVYTRILLPLADTYLERQRLLTYRDHFVTDAMLGLLRERCKKAFGEAKEKADMPFEETFRQALEAQGGPPSEAITATLVRALPQDEKKARSANFDKAWDQTVDTIHAGLKKRFDQLFAETLRGEAVVGAKTTRAHDEDGRRGPIARLLVGLVGVVAQDPQERAPDSKAYQLKLPTTQAYRQAFTRVQVVVGVPAAAAAVSRRAGQLRQMGRELSDYVLADRNAFLASQAALLEQAREGAAQLVAQLELLEKQRTQAAEQAKLVTLRRRDIKEYQTEWKESKYKTAIELKKLRESSRRLFDLRRKLRDAIITNEEAEKKIRELEEKIKELESLPSKRR